MPVPTYEQILALAPDESSARAGRELAISRKWKSLGCNEQAAWGECQGSGSNPYQTRIDLFDNAFKCTCPSRKFPCKHGLGLFLLLSKEPGLFSQSQPPQWVSEWLASRQSKQERKAKKQLEPATPPDPIAQAKRQNERNVKVSSGVEDLDRWLQDLVRRGTATVHNESYSFWENQAKRMVDAQATGLARMLKQCASTSSGREGWQDRLLQEMAQIKLLLQAYENIDQLPSEVQSDVRASIGFTVSQEEVLQQPAVRDTWFVIAQRVESDDRLRSQRTWLKGKESGRYAIVLSFAYGTATLDASLLAGYDVDADLAFYPGAHSLRALLKAKYSETPMISGMSGYASIETALSAYANALAVNPWIERFPMSIENVIPARTQSDTWIVIDHSGLQLPIWVDEMVGWQLMSASGGTPISIFGEWDGNRLFPMSLYAQEYFYRI